MRVYSYDEARRLVPELSRAITQMREAARGLAEVKARLQAAKTGLERRNLETEARFLEQSLEADRRWLESHGVVLRDLEEGVVDIPFRRGGELVYLTWRLGEEAPANWHGLTEDYHLRRPLSEGEEGPARRG